MSTPTREQALQPQPVPPAELAHRPSHIGRTVLVTGAGQGIGAAIALAFGRRRAKVAVTDIDAVRAEAIAAQIRAEGGAAAAGACDVADYNQLATACTALQTALGSHIDTIINNAGISPKHGGRAHKVWEMSPDEWARVTAVNLTGAFNTVRLLSPAMIEARFGAVVNMSSIAGRAYSDIVGIHYAATKAGLIGFTRHAAAELGPYNIRVNAIAPGRIETPLIRMVSAEVNEGQVQATPLRRLGQPEEVADLALYLTSNEASFVTGQVCDVAGGLMMT
jgi:3-oxoacyl-[acyl-carrier protein] reductase